MKRKTGLPLRVAVSMMIMLLLFFLLLVLNITLGSVNIPLSELIDVLLSRTTSDSTAYGIIWKLRLPRTFACVFLGGALALSGYLLQTFFNNPIAGPYVLGISSGAKLIVAIVMIFTIGSFGVSNPAVLIIAAFVGALGSMGLVLLLSQRVKSASMLIVSGVMIGYICSAITDFIVTFADEASIVNLHNWSRGSFSGIEWADVFVMAALVLIASVGAFLLSKPISAYLLGEMYAQNMGVNIPAFRAALVLLSSVLSACVTAYAGPISFVGIAVPHLAKASLRSSRPIIVIPACFLGGAIFCLFCDLLARVAFAPTEISISSVTALFGAPIVIAIMLKKKRGNE